MRWRSRLSGWVLGLGLACAAGALATAADIGGLLAGSGPDSPDPKSVQHGAELYATHCASCHDAGVNRAPQKVMLSMLAPRSIEGVLSHGVMKPMAAGLSDDDKRSLAEYLSLKRMDAAAPKPRMCAAGASPFDYGEPPPLAGWGLAGGDVHAITPVVAGLTPADLPRLKLDWSFAFPNALRARSQPTLGGGAIFVGSHDGSVFAIDRRTGCARWSYQAGAEVRTGVVLSPWRAGDRQARPLVYFGDVLGEVYALDATTGALAWKLRADPHPSATITGAPTLLGGKLIVPVSSLEEASAADPKYACCSFRGSVLALDARTGKKLWRSYTIDAPPTQQGVNPAGAARLGPSGAAVWGSPTVDPVRRRIYVATGDNYTDPVTPHSDAVLALDADTGRVLWAFQARAEAWNVSCIIPGKANCPPAPGPDYDFGAAPILAASADGQRFLLAGQKSGMVYGLDPDTGKLRWKTKIGRGGAAGGVHFGMSAQGGRLFAPVTDYSFPGDGPGTPGVYALDIKTGRVLWRFHTADCPGAPPACYDGFGGPPTAVGRMVLVGGDDGVLRALDAATGKLIWSYDTDRSFQTVNGETAHGGSISGGVGPIAYRGMLIVPSGHGFTNKKPGNVLLAFAVH